MENITAIFRNWTELEQASAALREQGAINIHVEPGSTGSNMGLEPTLQEAIVDSHEVGNDTEQEYILQVLVESSRSRQAEDTISRYGGQR